MGLENVYKLNTKHDYYHIHKILGILTIAQIAFRGFLWSRQIPHTMFPFANPYPEFIMIHVAISLSSLIYRIPENPNPKIPIIYNDYRKQNILFTMRSILCIYTYLYAPSNLIYTFIPIIIVSNSAIIDYIAKTPAVRSFPEISNITAGVFKYMNFVSTYGMLCGPDAAFAFLIPIQMSAFLLTLVKKNIICINTWVYSYLTIWLMCFFVAVSSKGAGSGVAAEMLLMAAYMYIWRVVLKYNKYVGWTHIFIVTRINLYCTQQVEQMRCRY